MEFSWAPSEHIKAISLWAVALTAMVAAVASAETVRDWIATSPDKFETHIVKFAQLENDWALKEIESLRREIKRTRLQMGEANDRGASPATLATYQELIDEYQQQIIDLRKRRN